jgi:hypothetical protein
MNETNASLQFRRNSESKSRTGRSNQKNCHREGAFEWDKREPDEIKSGTTSGESIPMDCTETNAKNVSRMSLACPRKSGETAFHEA